MTFSLRRSGVEQRCVGGLGEGGQGGRGEGEQGDDAHLRALDVLRGLEHKGLIQRQANPSDGRGVTVSPTERGRCNYTRVRHERATAVAAAAGEDTTNLDAALALLMTVKDGLARTRPPASSGHPPA